MPTTSPARTRAVVFDVNETLSDMTPLDGRFEEVGAPAHLRATWFAGVLRDGFALTASGTYAGFRDVARAGLSGLLAQAGVDAPAEAAEHVLYGLGHLSVHHDVPGGVRALRAAGLRLVTMTNGAAASSERLLTGAGLADCFEGHFDVSGPRAWKPAPAAYHHALDGLGLPPAEALLVAVHPWDVDGALRAGLPAVWLRRTAVPYPEVFRRPTHTVHDLRDLPSVLADAGTPPDAGRAGGDRK